MELLPSLLLWIFSKG
uniref:Uncharacterized protein n=1 Tax=Rhizophora mucronata TaxID=61149 RepID=A0A2P2IWZ6_RHIMU